MNKQIDWIKKTRASLLQLIEPLSTEQLNKVPPGFNNNIIWNIAHLFVVQQGICYARGGVALIVDKKYITAYTRGTKPDGFVDANEIAIIKGLLLSTLDNFQEDYDNNIFSNYIAWTTPYGVELNNIDEAIQFLIFHEGLHYGYVMALKRLVTTG